MTDQNLAHEINISFLHGYIALMDEKELTSFYSHFKSFYDSWFASLMQAEKMILERIAFLAALNNKDKKEELEKKGLIK
jgi:hypothetical protein